MSSTPGSFDNLPDFSSLSIAASTEAQETAAVGALARTANRLGLSGEPFWTVAAVLGLTAAAESLALEAQRRPSRFEPRNDEVA